MSDFYALDVNPKISYRRECILNCPRVRGTILHAFPRDEVRRQVWLKLINMEYTSKVNMYLCGRHFSPRMVGKRNLKNDAVPDINLEYVDDQTELCFEDDGSIEFADDNSININSQQTTSPLKIIDIAHEQPMSSDNFKMVTLPKNVKLVHVTKPTNSDPLFVPLMGSSSQNRKEQLIDGNSPGNKTMPKPLSTEAVQGNLIRIAVKKRAKKDEKLGRMRTPLAPLEMKLATRIWQTTEGDSESSKKLPTLKTQPHPKIQQNPTTKSISNRTAKNKINWPSKKTNCVPKALEKLVISPEGPVRVQNIHEIDGTWKEQAKKVAEEIENAKSLLFETNEESSPVIIENRFELEDEQHLTITDDNSSQHTTTTTSYISHGESGNTQPTIEFPNVRRDERTMNDLLCDEILPNNDLLCDEVLPNDDDDHGVESALTSNVIENKKADIKQKLSNEETVYPESPSSSNILMMGVEDFKKIADESVYRKNNFLVSKSLQTGSMMKHACGFIEKYSHNGTFNLSCFFCKTEFPMWDWQKFINHVSIDHKSQMNPKCYNVAQEEVKKVPKSQPLRSYPHYPSTDLDRLIVPNSKVKYAVVQGAVPNTVAILPLHNISGGKTASEQKVNTGSEEQRNECSDHNRDSDEDSRSSIEDFYKNKNIIRINKTNPERVMNFLKVLKEHPVLWHTRRHGPTIYDKETEEFIRKFDPTMPPMNFRISMDHIRYWHRRNTPDSICDTTSQLDVQTAHYSKCYEMMCEIEVESKQYAFYCDQCEYYFLDIDRLATHKYLKHNVGDLKFPCSCGLRFETAKKKDEHERSHKPKPSFMCELCGMTFAARYSLSTHFNTKHADVTKNPLPYKCTKCEERFPNLHMRSWHILKHAPPRFTCKICGRKYYKTFQFKHHMKKHLDQRDYVCEDCGKGFVEKRALLNHRYRMHDIGGYYCEYCNTYYSTFEKLDAHNKSIHPNGTNTDRPYSVRYRNLRYPTRKTYTNRTFKCKQCGTLFERQYQLMRHKRQLGHTLGERYYKCSHCTSVFKSRVTLVRHLRMKHGLRTRRGDFKEEDYCISTPEHNNFEESSEINNECDYAVQTIICSGEDENIIEQDGEIQEIFEEFAEELKIDSETSNYQIS